MATNSDIGSAAEASSEENVQLLGNNRNSSRRKQISWPSAAVMITNSAIGAGLLAFPSAFAHAGGYIEAVALLVTIALFSFASLMICGYCATLCRCSSYQTMVTSLVHRGFGTLCAVQMFLYTFGSCVSYLIILGDQCDQIYALTGHDPHDPSRVWYFGRRFLTIVISAAVVLPLCLPKRIEFLRYVSAATNVSLLYVVGLVISSYFFGVTPEPHSLLSHHSLKTLQQFNLTEEVVTDDTESTHFFDAIFSALPIVCFGFQCQINAIPVYAAQRRRTTGEFARVNGAAVSFTLVVYALTGAFGFATFGSAVQSDVLLSYTPSVQVAIAVIIICVLMISAYPLMSFVARATVAEFLAQIFALCSSCASPSNEEERPRVINEYEQLPDDQSVSRDAEQPAESGSQGGEPVDHLTQLAGGSRARERVYRVIITLVWYSTTLFLAVFIPTLGNVIGVLGTFAACFIFVYPGLCLLCLILAIKDRAEVNRRQRIEPTLINSSISDLESSAAYRVVDDSVMLLSRKKYYSLLFVSVLFVVLGMLLFGCTLTQAIFKLVS